MSDTQDIEGMSEEKAKELLKEIDDYTVGTDEHGDTFRRLEMVVCGECGSPITIVNYNRLASAGTRECPLCDNVERL